MPRQNYSDWSHEDLVKAVVARDGKVAELNRSKRQMAQALQRALRGVKRKYEIEPTDDMESSYTLLSVPDHGYRSHFQKSQLIAIGLRRNLSNVSSTSCGLVTATTISRQSVCKAEVYTGWHLRERFKWWVADHIADMQTNKSQRSLMVVSWASDATNSAVWQRRKLQALILAVRCCIAGIRSCMRGTADILPVEDASDKGAEALMRKQLTGMGVPMPWCGQALGYDCPLRFWIFASTTDCGPDQLMCRKITAAKIRRLPRVGFISMNCMCHQAQLVCSGGLILLDNALKLAGAGWSYYSGVCKLVHVWRDLAKDIFRAWVAMHGAISAQRCASRFPAKCVACRWLSLCNTEKYLLDRAHLAPAVVARVVQGQVGTDDDNSKGGHLGDINDINIEEMKAHRVKIGRWRRDVLRTISDKRFWAIMEMVHRARQPLDQAHAFFQKKKFTDVHIHGFHLRRLVNGRAEAMVSQMEAELKDQSLWWATHVALLDPEDHTWVTQLNACTMLFSAASFDRRVIAILREFPFRMLRMRRSPPEEDCPLRRRTAGEILSLRDGRVADSTTIKIANHYCDVLEIARDEGILHNDLLELLDHIDECTIISAQEVESINSMIPRQGKASRNQCLDLLSSRICIKKEIGVDNLQSSWQVVQPQMESMFRSYHQKH